MIRLSSLSLVSILSSVAVAQDAVDIQLVNAFPEQAPFDRPILIDFHASDPGHCLVLEQYGKVYRVPLGDRDERTLIADFSERTFHPKNKGHNEEGLLGFAFDPDFAENGHVFVYYSEKTGEEMVTGRRGRKRKVYSRRSVLARMDAALGDAATIDPSTELRILEVDQPWGNHNGGTIVFGPDGMLYVALGDGGARADRAGNGQNLATLLGSVLRIDVREATADQLYKVPKDNPFVGREDACGEIWAYGLRNPWRIAFDRETGDLWCGDVGQDRHEEVDRLVAGGNYGWPKREGLHEFPPVRQEPKNVEHGFVDPVAEYPRKSGISITGGHVYRGAKIPELVGYYVYGDFASMNLWAVKEDRAGGEHQVVKLGRARGPLASFGEGPDGELFALCYDGKIYRFESGSE